MFHKDHEITAKNQPRQKTKDIVCVCVHVHVYSLHITGINQQKNIAYTQSFHSALPENFVPFRELHSSLKIVLSLIHTLHVSFQPFSSIRTKFLIHYIQQFLPGIKEMSLAGKFTVFKVISLQHLGNMSCFANRN